MCDFWSHFKCTTLTVNQFKNLVANKNESFICNLCYDNIFPFNKINNTELLILNFCFTKESIKTNTRTGQSAAFAQYTSADNLINLNNKNIDNELSFLHVNIRSLTKNVSLLEELLFSYKILPDIIGISETKLNKNSNINSILLNGYKFHFLNSQSNAGGVGLYINPL